MSFTTVNMEGFCSANIKQGNPVSVVPDEASGCLKVVPYNGEFAGVALYNIVDIDLTKEYVSGWNLPMHSKFPIAISGYEILLPLHGKVGQFIRPRKDGSWKVGCKRKSAVGVFVRREGSGSIIRLL